MQNRTEGSYILSPLLRSVLVLGIVAGIFLRFWDLGFMEFKSDESTAMTMAEENIRKPGSVRVGLPSSVGLLNPPFFIYILSIPTLISSDPIFVTAFIGLLNVCGIWILFRFIKSFYTNTIALVATSLFASAPWTIIYSRKIWMQDALSPFLFLLYWLLFSNIKKYSSIKTAGIFILLAVITQLHMSAWFLPLPLLIFLSFLPRQKKIYRDMCIGILLFLMIYAPFLSYHISSQFSNIHTFLALRGTTHTVVHPINNILWMFQINTGLGMQYLIGEKGMAAFTGSLSILPFLFGWMWIVTSIAAVAVVMMCKDALHSIRRLLRDEKIDVREFIPILLILIILCIHIVYILMKVATFPHYQIIFYPSVSLCIALLFVRLKGKYVSILAQGFIAMTVICNIIVIGTLLHFIHVHPSSIDGDYGIPYALTKTVHN